MLFDEGHALSFEMGLLGSGAKNLEHCGDDRRDEVIGFGGGDSRGDCALNLTYFLDAKNGILFAFEIVEEGAR